MAEIKRPNYFTSQFLVEKDFNDEQAYHLGMRRRLNRSLHTSGVIEGLTVTRVGAKEVEIAPGIAVDRDGREIVLVDARRYTLTTVGNNVQVNLTIAYRDEFDPADRYTQAGQENYVRTTERPLVSDGTAPPAADGSVILLARITLNGQGAIESNGSINNAVRPQLNTRIPIGTAQLADSSVTLAKLATQPVVSVKNVPGAGGNIEVLGANAISVAANTTTRTITIGENHSALTNNPHRVTAGQIGALHLQDYFFAQAMQASLVFTEADGNNATRTISTAIDGEPFRAKFVWAIASYGTRQLGDFAFGGSAPAFADLRNGIQQCGVQARVEAQSGVGQRGHEATVTPGWLCSAHFMVDDDVYVFGGSATVQIDQVSDSHLRFMLYRTGSSTGQPLTSFELRLQLMIFG